VERVDIAVVREKALNDRMELEAAYPEVADQPARLAHAHLAARRIDAGEGYRDVGVLMGRLGDLLVADAPDPHPPFVIYGEHHEAHLAAAIVVGHLRYRRMLDLVAEILAPGLERFGLGLVGQDARRDLGVRMDVDGD